ncbi:S-adenosyl-L-methionine-dependent methyltransferase [Chloropicon primus]|uniref:S-adenosyl-L-methionine-dependent methyltransferase n=2 Tax=Chloropicon primus TaxID=1764295 RepID=A0A5B8MT55_9CHLO|nr:S-adenosyl-L-methionine-dependent methyltransferase [Chloropicon primus]UPR02709.1 S-adenosyl-L-methionine-dependent methyltransferase [Chloropicon primus]|eukprot:QDZ23497.1 S-adenosyl-L-methionine-dependent methyltransferase [Chloropicon primus]
MAKSGRAGPGRRERRHGEGGNYNRGGGGRGRRRLERNDQNRRNRNRDNRNQRGREFGSVRFPKDVFFATCHPGLEHVVAKELLNLEGVHNVVEGRAGVNFCGDSSSRYSANLNLRSSVRVLELIAEGELDVSAGAGNSVYNFARQIDWPRYIERGSTFKVKSVVYDNTEVTNSLLVSKRTRDAVCDTLRDDSGFRPEDPRDRAPDVPLQVVIYRDFARVYLDTSGESLHKRGYRTINHKASLNEAAAAGLLQIAGVGPTASIMDPMCGSGTFLIEAALVMTRTAPGIYRERWPFERWPDFSEEQWETAIAKAEDLILDPETVLARGGMCLGNDIHPSALALAKADARKASLSGLISFNQGSCESWRPAGVSQPDLVITNPPWGERLNDDNLAHSWRELGNFLKMECSGADAYVLSGSRTLTQHLRLAAKRKHKVTLGGIDCRLLQYQIF